MIYKTKNLYSHAIFLFLLYFFLIIFNPSISQSNFPTFKESNRYFDSLNLIYKQLQIDSLFNSIVNENKFNGALLVAKGEKIVYENVAGYSNFSSKTPLTLNSSFEIASVSKMFTAAAILLLYEEEKIDLSKNVKDYLPDFPYENITIHHLLCHRSGLPEYFNFAKRYHKNHHFPLTNDSLLLMINKYKPKLKKNPNREFEYNNTGYAILASIVEKITGITFKEFVETKFFKPLEMEQTFFYLYGETKNINIGHYANKKEYKRDCLSGVIGDKGIFSSVHDLYKWNNALFSGKIIKTETLKLAEFPNNKEQDNCNNYGYGLRISCDENNNTLLFHGGLWNGNNSLFIHRPSDKTVIIVLSNIFNRSFTGKSVDILHILDEL